MIPEHMKCCLMLFIIKKMQIKTSLRYRFSTFNWYKFKTLIMNSADKAVEKQVFSHIALGMQNCTILLKNLAISNKIIYAFTLCTRNPTSRKLP